MPAEVKRQEVPDREERKDKPEAHRTGRHGNRKRTEREGDLQENANKSEGAHVLAPQLLPALLSQVAPEAVCAGQRRTWLAQRRTGHGRRLGGNLQLIESKESTTDVE